MDNMKTKISKKKALKIILDRIDGKTQKDITLTLKHGKIRNIKIS